MSITLEIVLFQLGDSAPLFKILFGLFALLYVSSAQQFHLFMLLFDLLFMFGAQGFQAGARLTLQNVFFTFALQSLRPCLFRFLAVVIAHLRAVNAVFPFLDVTEEVV